MKRFSPLSSLLLACAVLYTATPATAQNRTLVIGDSGSEEYAVEVTFSSPSTSNGIQARNWVELLATQRSNDFNFGSLKPAFGNSLWADYRTWGYQHNFSFPGDTTQDGADKLTATPSSDFVSWLATQAMNNALSSSIDRVVIFLGANDARDYYQDIYNGNLSQLNAFSNQVIGNLTSIIDHVQGQNPSLPIVMVNIPDVGATPDQQSLSPDPVKREDYTVRLKTVNNQINALAAQKGVAVADVYSVSRDIMRGEPLYLGGLSFTPQGHPDNDSLHLFCRDNFHPNTTAQALYARAIINAFNDYHGAGIDKLGDGEILAWQSLGALNPTFWQFEPVRGWEQVTSATDRNNTKLGYISLAVPGEEDLFWSARWSCWLSSAPYESGYFSHHHHSMWINPEDNATSGWSYSYRMDWAFTDDNWNSWCYSTVHGWLWVNNNSGQGMYYSQNNGWIYIHQDGSVYSFALNQWLP